MADIKEIITFVKDCFDNYGIRYKDYYLFDFDYGISAEISWTNEEGNPWPKIIPFVSEILGLSEKDIVECNEDAADIWYNKYPYFSYFKQYAIAYEHTFYDDETFELKRFLNVFLNDPADYLTPNLIDYSDVKERLISQLKDLDKSLPGTFHEGAKITKLQIGTANIFEFKYIKELVNSFISLVDRAIFLFLKAIKEDLAYEEMQEYNFLVSVLGLRDRYYTKGYLYYSGLTKVRELYADLNEMNIRNSIVFKRGLEFKPWRCAGFINDVELVRRYLDRMPEAKGEMREFATLSLNYECFFVWSDAETIHDLFDEFEFEDDFFDEESLSHEKEIKEPTTIYVPKKPAELRGFELTARKLMEYCRPAKLGGMENKMPIYSDAAMIQHIEYLLGKINSNCFFEWIVSDINSSGGGDHDAN